MNAFQRRLALLKLRIKIVSIVPFEDQNCNKCMKVEDIIETEVKIDMINQKYMDI